MDKKYYTVLVEVQETYAVTLVADNARHARELVQRDHVDLGHEIDDMWWTDTTRWISDVQEDEA